MFEQPVTRRGRGVLIAGLMMVFGLLPQVAAAQVPLQVPPSTTTSAGPASITQGVWQWQRTEYSDDSVVNASDPSRYTVTFMPGGRLAIRADCNNVTGTYIVDGQSLRIQLGATTLVACPPDSQDTIFLRDLGNVVTYVFDGDQLVLNIKFDSGNMIFSPLPPASLTGATWRVTNYNNGHGGVVSVVADTQISAMFGDDGHVSGETGCNIFNGTYSVAGSGISFGPFITTRRACTSDAASAQEAQFLGAMEASTTYELVGDRLTLRSDSGATQVIMVRPTVEPPPS